MRTKILLAAAAAMAAGVVASNAQVYSANVVGYYNVQIPANTLTLTANQLNNSTSNDLNTILGALPNKSSVQVWNGAGFTPATKTSSGWSPDPEVPVGSAFFVSTPATAGLLTNTFVGSVIVGPGQSYTNNLQNGILAMVGSPIPYATDLDDTNNTLNLSSLPNKSSVQVWNGSGYTPATKTSGGWSPDLSISVGQGFFVSPAGTSGTTPWVQTLPSN